MTDKDRVQIQLFIERDLHDAIVDQANKNERSMAAQARYMLKDWFNKQLQEATR